MVWMCGEHVVAVAHGRATRNRRRVSEGIEQTWSCLSRVESGFRASRSSSAAGGQRTFAAGHALLLLVPRARRRGDGLATGGGTRGQLRLGNQGRIFPVAKKNSQLRPSIVRPSTKAAITIGRRAMNRGSQGLWSMRMSGPGPAS